MRGSVKWFSEQMENRLRKKDKEKGYIGWRGCDKRDLFLWMDDKQHELAKAIVFEDNDQIIKLSTDIANYAMMIADNFREDES